MLAANNAIEDNRKLDEAARALGFKDGSEQREAAAGGFTSPDAFRKERADQAERARIWKQKQEEAAAKAKAEADAKQAVEELQWKQSIMIVLALKKTMKNPASFKLESAIRTVEGFYCFEYRATNSFNAIVPGKAVVGGGKAATSDDRTTFIPLWNKHCTKPGENLTTLVFAFEKGYF